MANAELDGNTERLNAAIAAAEVALLAQGFGVRARVLLNPDQWLVFGKINKGWRLMVETPQATNLLTDTSRETRVAAASLLPSLLKALRDEATAQAVKVSEAANAVEQFAESLSRVLEKP